MLSGAKPKILAVGMESQYRCWRLLEIKLRAILLGELPVPGGTQMQEAKKRKPRGKSRVHKLPGMLPEASRLFQGRKGDFQLEAFLQQ